MHARSCYRRHASASGTVHVGRAAPPVGVVSASHCCLRAATGLSTGPADRPRHLLGTSHRRTSHRIQALKPAMDVPAMRAASVVVVTKPGCPYCKRAKAALQQADVAYAELDASQDTQLRALVRELSNSATVPQVFVGGVSVGGSDALAEGLASGSFQQALSAAQARNQRALPDAILVSVEQLVRRHKMASAAETADSQQQAARRLALQGVADMLDDASTGITTREERLGARVQRCFTGQQLVDWLVAQAAHPSAKGHSNSTSTSSRTAAREWLQRNCSSAAAVASAGQQLLDANLISVAADMLPALPPPAASGGAQQQQQQLQPGQLYLLVSQAADPPRGSPLNTGYWWNGPARPATQVAQDLRELIMRLYDAHLSADGRAVSYAGIRADPLFPQYVRATAELQRVDLGPLDRAELMALFINLYNALIVHALVVLGAPANASQRGAFFQREAAYCIGGHTYTADDMENGVLRGNRAPASNLLSLVGLPQLGSKQFKSGDPRLAKVVSPMDPRIHFALVCGAKSCPPISVYTPDNLDEGLQAAGEAFCSSEVEVDRAAGVVTLSKILQWYSIDFGSNDRQKLQYVLQFMKGRARQDLEALLASGRVIVKYKPYDWGLNE